MILSLKGKCLISHYWIKRVWYLFGCQEAQSETQCLVTVTELTCILRMKFIC
jgi:hypothetical protein